MGNIEFCVNDCYRTFFVVKRRSCIIISTNGVFVDPLFVLNEITVQIVRSRGLQFKAFLQLITSFLFYSYKSDLIPLKQAIFVHKVI